MPPPKLIDQVHTTAALRHLSLRPVEAYTRWLKRFILFHHKKHPLTIGAYVVHAFLAHLAQPLNVSASTQNQALNAIAFLYRQVLQHDLGAIDNIPRAKRPKRLPVVFSPAEIRLVLSNMSGTISMVKACFNVRSRSLSCAQESQRTEAGIRSGIRSQPNCWKWATISAPSGNCWATVMSGQQ